MHLPTLPSLPPLPAEDLYAIRQRPPVTPARFVRARNLPALLIPPKRRGKAGEGVIDDEPQTSLQAVESGGERCRQEQRTVRRVDIEV